MNHQDVINQLRKSLPQTIAQEIVGVQPMGRAVPETWQSYLRRLGNGLNGVATNKYITEADIVENAQKYMMLKYPGNYQVEPYYSPDKMKWDLRLKFANPKEETLWLIKYSA